MIGSLIYVRVSGFDFLPVLEGKPDVVLCVDCDVVHQSVPSFQCEFWQLIRQLFKGLQEGFVVGSLGLLLADLLGDFLKASLGLVEALRQGVVPFLVFGLIQSNVGVFVNALLHHVGNHLRFLQELIVLSLKRCGVKEDGDHGVAVCDNLTLRLQQLVHCLKEGGLNLLVRQVRCAAGLVAVVLMVAALDDLPVFAVGVPDL